MSPKTLLLSTALVIATAAQAQTGAQVEAALDAIVNRAVAQQGTKKVTQNEKGLHTTYTSQTPWRDEEALSLIRAVYRAFETDTAGCIGVEQVVFEPTKDNHMTWNIKTPIGPLSILAFDQNAILGRYRVGDENGRAELTYCLQWVESVVGGYYVSTTKSILRNPDGAPTASQPTVNNYLNSPLLLGSHRHILGGIFGPKEKIGDSEVNCTDELLRLGVNLEVLRAQVDAECERLETAYDLRDDEMRVAEDVYRQTLSNASAHLEESKKTLRAAFDHSKDSHAEALRKGKISSDVYAKRMKETADGYTANLSAASKQYNQAVHTATADYEQTIQQLTKKYENLTLFPCGKPIEEIDRGYTQLCQALGATKKVAIATYLRNKLQRFLKLAAREMSEDSRLDWLSKLPKGDDNAPLRELLLDTNK